MIEARIILYVIIIYIIIVNIVHTLTYDIMFVMMMMMMMMTQHTMSVCMVCDGVIMGFTVTWTAIRSRHYPVLCSVVSPLLLDCLYQ